MSGARGVTLSWWSLSWAAGSLVVVGAGAFGPWAQRFGFRFNATDDEFVGLIALVASVALVVLVLTRNRWLAVVPLVASLVSAMVIGHLADPVGPFGGPGRNIHLEWGIWTALGGSLALAFASATLLVNGGSLSRVRTPAARRRAFAAPGRDDVVQQVDLQRGRPEQVRARKWWRQAEAAPTAAEFARMNARAAVPIEVATGHRFAGAESTPAGDEPRVKEVFLQEAHHAEYGRPWVAGRDMFEFAVGAGVRPQHRVLDFGCGALRFGIWMVDYLDADRYFGVESHLGSLEAAATYEIPCHGLESKRPRLLWNRDLAFSHFGTKFDWIVDLASSNSLKPKRLRKRVYPAFADALVSGGHLLVVPEPAVPIEAFRESGLAFVRGPVLQRCPLLEGHDASFTSTLAWWEFVRE